MTVFRQMIRSMKSLRARVVIIFLLMILLAMQLIGWYVERSLEDYYLGNTIRNVERQARLLASFLERYLAEEAPVEYIAEYLRDYGRESGLDLILVDSEARVTTTSSGLENLVDRRIVLPEIDQALTEGLSAQQIRDQGTGRDPVLSLAMPILGDGRIIGSLYINASLSGVYQTLHDVRTILLAAGALALGITGAVALFVAGTITGPVGAITQRAAAMAAGDFSREIEVYSEDEIGQLASMFNFMADRLKNTLSEVSEEKRRLEVVLINMADGVVALDADGRVTLANPRALTVMGIDHESQARAETSLDEAFRRLPLAPPVREILETGDDVTLRFELEDPHRVIRAHLAAITPEDSPRGLVVVLQDITEQEREEERRKEFVANVSHELKTPLTTIKSYVETLYHGAMDDEKVGREFLGVVLDESDRMARMVRDLLDLSLIDSGKMAWEEAYFSLPELVDEACGKIAPKADQKSISLGYRGDDMMPMVYGDRDRIEQVLVNLIGNAVDYTPERGQVRVLYSQQGEYGRVSVIDNGMGIPPDELPRIFERFYRVDKARTRSSGGTGLGLAIAREIIESHGGSIAAKSIVGKGTEMTFLLPLERGQE